MSNKQLIETFYQAFQQRDYQTMARCYHPHASFRDEGFTLHGKEVLAMWHMLCERGKDLSIEFSVSEHNGRVSAHWEPRYTFSQSGRWVHNIIDAEFEFKEGLIYRHVDRFSFWRWSRQALGVLGFLLGWSGWLHRKVRRGANEALQKFIQKHPEYR